MRIWTKLVGLVKRNKKDTWDYRSWSYPYQNPVIPVEEISSMVKLFEFKPEHKYIMWFKYPVSVGQVSVMRRMVNELGLDPTKVSVIFGVTNPVMYDLGTGEEQLKEVKTV